MLKHLFLVLLINTSFFFANCAQPRQIGKRKIPHPQPALQVDLQVDLPQTGKRTAPYQAGSCYVFYCKRGERRVVQITNTVPDFCTHYYDVTANQGLGAHQTDSEWTNVCEECFSACLSSQ